jgi:hypothetical protein
MHVDRFGDFGSSGLGVFVQEVLGTQSDPGYAKSALHAGGGHESPRKQIALFAADTFQGEDVFARRRLGRHSAGDFGASIH